MPSFLQLTSIAYTDVAETIFIGGTTLTNTTATSFETVSGNIRVLFQGTGLTYGAGGTLTGGTLDRYVVYQGPSGSQTALIQGDSNFTLLTAAEVNAAFGLARGGNLSGAADLVTQSWTQEFFWHTNYSGGYLKGYSGGDGLSGSVIADQIYGNGGGDVITLNTGDDEGYGGGSNDFIYGHFGNDTIYGGDDNDQLRSEDGDDQLYDSSGVNGLYGGKGNDLAYGGSDADTLLGGSSADIPSGNAGNDQLIGDAGDDAMDGGAGDDRLEGKANNDTVLGSDGNDTLSGGAGDDQVHGGAGRDRLVGGTGSDLLSGGTQADSFVMALDAGSADAILDFGDNVDAIALRAFGFSDAASALAGASEVAGNVTLDLGNGQSLTIFNATIAALSDDLIL